MHPLFYKETEGKVDRVEVKHFFRNFNNHHVDSSSLFFNKNIQFLIKIDIPMKKV
jgi:hypothetical protein